MFTKQEILDALAMPWPAFQAAFAAPARAAWRARGNVMQGVAMIGFSNICRNQCLYCGMRAGNTALPRYRLTASQVRELAQGARQQGFGRLFLISGEDPRHNFAPLLEMVAAAAGMGFRVTLACGEYEPAQYQELKAVGAAEYVVKFEMSNPASFNRLNPSTSFAARMAAIEAVQRSGMLLASGNIIDWPGQTLDELAEDILLTARLQVSWAPVVPYLPAANTPLAQEGGRGSVELALREIALLRLMLPQADITGGQPGEDMRNGFSDRQGNLNALAAGANVLFADLLPAPLADDFRVTDHRAVQGLAHLQEMAALSGMQLRLD